MKSGKLLMIALMPWGLVRKSPIIARGRVSWGVIKMGGLLSQAPGTWANKTAYATDRQHFSFGNTLFGDITMYKNCGLTFRTSTWECYREESCMSSLWKVFGKAFKTAVLLKSCVNGSINMILEALLNFSSMNKWRNRELICTLA